MVFMIRIMATFDDIKLGGERSEGASRMYPHRCDSYTRLLPPAVHINDELHGARRHVVREG